MANERERILERWRQSRDRHRAELMKHARPPACAEGRLGCHFDVGARVFDRVTGQYVEVVGGSVENVILPASQE